MAEWFWEKRPGELVPVKIVGKCGGGWYWVEYHDGEKYTHNTAHKNQLKGGPSTPPPPGDRGDKE